MREWTQSSLIANLPKWHEDNKSLKTRALADFIVTLHMFNIAFKPLDIYALGPVVWEYAANYRMSRDYLKPVDLDLFN